MGRYGIGLLALLLGGAGIAYVVMSPSPEDSETLAVGATAAPDEAEPAPGERPAITGSANRRMDDFGSGPSGVTVTVPLRDRHNQAFKGGSSAGGGGGEPSYRVVERTPEGGDPPAKDGAPPPSFDIVRVDPAGSTVLAGRAAPLTDVEIKAGDRVIDRVTTTATGEWVSTPVDPLAPGDQELSLTAVDETGEAVESREVVVVSIPEPDEGQGEQPVAVVVDKAEGGEGRVLQAPDKLESDDGDGRLALKLVDYDDEGAIKLSGEAPPGVPVRIYIDNEPAALVIGDSKGDWITTLDQDLPGGDYTLRLDQLDNKGETVARLETPFTRVTAPPVEGEAKVDYVVVQPGNSLWRIARRLSGDGFNYVYIFEANQAQIKDPDVIYPGQVFEVPTDVSAEIAG